MTEREQAETVEYVLEGRWQCSCCLYWVLADDRGTITDRWGKWCGGCWWLCVDRAGTAIPVTVAFVANFVAKQRATAAFAREQLKSGETSPIQLHPDS